MDLKYTVILNLYSILILMIIFFNSLKQDDQKSLQHKLYKLILYTTILLLIVDLFSRFDGKPDTMYSTLNYYGNLLIFILGPVLPSFWLLYVHNQVFQEERKTKRLFYPLILVNLFNIIMVCLTQVFGWYYYIDINNVYHKGPLYPIAVLVIVSFVILSFIWTIIRRKEIDKTHFYALLFFISISFSSMALQLVIYGVPFMLNGVALSLLIVYLSIQNDSKYIDYLTGVYNRKKLNIYLKGKINKSSENKSFSAIMIDINDFKSINDLYGHDMGDVALQDLTEIFRRCIRVNDLIARYGGDEFCIVLNTSDKKKLDQIVSRIHSTIETHNKSSKKPYHLSVSMGSAVYDYQSKMGLEEFHKRIDQLMYENKNK